MKKKIILVAVLSFIMIFITGCGKQNINVSEKDNKKVSKNDFIDVSFSLSKGLLNGKYIVALTSNGDLYANGNVAECEFDKYDIIEKNVKKFIHYNYFLVLKNNGELEYKGLGLSGGTISKFEKIFDNAIDMSTNGFTIFTIDKNNNLYARFNSFGSSNQNYNAGITEDCSEDFVKIRENVKKAIPTLTSYYFIDVNNNLYSKVDGEEKLLGENIVDFALKNYDNLITLDKNGSAYFYDNEEGTYEKIADNIKKISNSYLIDKDNYAYNIDDGQAVKIEEIKNVDILDDYGNYYNFDTHKSEKKIEYVTLDGKLHSYIDGVDTVLTEKDYKNIKNK